MVTITPIFHEGAETLSLRQLDELNAVPKGTSFKAFKHCAEQLQDGRGYYYLQADENKALIDLLKSSGQIYGSTVHLVLLTRSGYQQIRAG